MLDIHHTPHHPLPDTLPSGAPWPLISVVTPSLNQGKYLEACIQSILNQGYPNVEHIVIDGGSTDETEDILKQYETRLAYVVSEEDRGQSHAINKGFSRAGGEILTWLNADDQLAPNALAAMALAFECSGADVVAGICQLLHGDEIVSEHLTGCPDGKLPLNELLDLDGSWLRGRFFYQPEVMFSRKIWEAAGGYVDEDLYYSMDYDLWVRFAAAGARLHVTGSPVAIFRVHEEQKTSQPENYQPELRRVNKTLQEKYDVSVPDAETSSSGETLPRVVLLNDVGFNYGAGIAHGRLAHTLQMHGHEVESLCLSGEDLVPCRVGDGDVLSAIDEAKPDLVLLGNMHGARIKPELIGQISRRWPTYSVMHDFWLLTGRCAYAGSCTKFESGCDHTCPTADDYPVLDRTKIAIAWEKKHEILADASSPVLLANSGYTEQTARKMVGSRSQPDIAQVALGVPTDVFFPRDKAECRKALGLPQDAFVILFSACSINDPRKGLRHLADALEKLQIPNLHLACVGNAHSISEYLPNTTKLGYVASEESLAEIYSAADVYVGPSLEETFGQVYVEAAACGTPSIGYRVAGTAEAIADGVTGIFADGHGPEFLAKAIQRIYGDPALRVRLNRLGPLYVRNERNLTTMYRSLYRAFEQTGQRFGIELPAPLRRNVESELPELPTRLGRLPTDRPSVEFGFGFWEWEGPYPERGLPRMRWATGMRSTLYVNIIDAGRYWLELACLCSPTRREFSVSCDRRYVATYRLAPAETQAEPSSIRVELALSPGPHEVGLHFYNWQEEDGEGRQLALMLTDVTIRRRFVLFGRKSLLSNLVRRFRNHRRVA